MINEFNKLKKSGFYPNKILDIGANVGDFTNMLKSIWHDSDYYLVEATNGCENSLSKISDNVYIEVLGKNDGDEVNFYMTTDYENCTGNSIYLEKTKHYGDENLIIEKRKTIKLSTLFTSEKFDIIKLDTQGSELDIIKGGVDIIKNSKYVLIETSLKEYNKGAPLEKEVVDFMSSIGFTYTVIDNHVWPRDIADGEELDIVRGEIFQRDLLFENNLI